MTIINIFTFLLNCSLSSFGLFLSEQGTHCINGKMDGSLPIHLFSLLDPVQGCRELVISSSQWARRKASPGQIISPPKGQIHTSTGREQKYLEKTSMCMWITCKRHAKRPRSRVQSGTSLLQDKNANQLHHRAAIINHPLVFQWNLLCVQGSAAWLISCWDSQTDTFMTSY